MKKILIYDDEEPFANTLKENLAKLPVLEGIFEVETLSEEEFQGTMEVLKKRQIALRKDDEWGDERSPLDEASIFIVDYDLLYSTAGDFLTGELVAYLARCFSECRLIVGYRYGDNAFDLTLRGQPESFADLYVGGRHLSNPGLWGVTEATEVGFRPWCWPILPDYLRDFEKKVEGVKTSLAEDVPICQVLGFSPELFVRLPRSIGQFLGAKPAETTFRQFVTKSGNGLEQKDATSADDVSEDALARVGAARISKWLERLVLPEQDILVDAPHLVSRYPSLMTGDAMDIEIWNRTARLVSHENLGLRTDLIEPFRLKKDHWLSRPVWFWDEVRECQDILEVREPWKMERPNWVFCEDASRFYEEGYREFVADVESPFARRFVKNFESVDYRPKVRFSL
ncbi:MAG: hypothetical protein ACE5H0_07205 [Bacteroidota bacterium]